MPNWNTNLITLKGTKGDIRKFLEKHIINNSFDYETIIPSPKTKKECPTKYITDDPRGKDHITPDSDRPWFNWYKWNNENWGCKWNGGDTFVNDLEEAFPDTSDDTRVLFQFSFDSPWCPPMPVFVKLVDMYKDSIDIHIFYIEEGMGFCGTYDSESGDQYYEGDWKDPEFRQMTIDEGYYDQDYWDELDEQMGDDEEETETAPEDKPF